MNKKKALSSGELYRKYGIVIIKMCIRDRCGTIVTSRFRSSDRFVYHL